MNACPIQKDIEKSNTMVALFCGNAHVEHAYNFVAMIARYIVDDIGFL
jgi:hypothetical protein